MAIQTKLLGDQIEQSTLTAAGAALTPTTVAATGTVTGSNLSGTNTGNQTITLTGDVTGSGTGTFATTLSDTGVTPGAFTSANVSVDSKGRITAISNGSGGGGGGSPGGVDTNIQFNNAGAFGGSANLVWNNTTSTLTTGNLAATGSTTVVDIGVNGNLTFVGNSRLITADFSNGTQSNRTYFQSSTLNGATNVGAKPNGTSVNASFSVENNSVIANNAGMSFGISAAAASITNFIRGTGTFLPFQILNGVGALQGLTVDTLGNTVFGGTAALTTGATSHFAYVNSMAGTPTGVPVVPNGVAGAMSGKTAITFDTTNNLFYFYSSGAWRTPAGGGGGGVPEAPIDGLGYVRKDAAWTSIISGGTY